MITHFDKCSKGNKKNHSYVQDNTSWQSYLVYLLTSVYTTCEELPLNQLNTLKHT